MCGRHSADVDGKLACEQCAGERAERARKRVEEANARAAEEATRVQVATAARVREAAILAATALKTAGVAPRRLATVDKRASVAARGDFLVAWDKVTRDVGLGWHAVRLEGSRPDAGGQDGTFITYVEDISLTEDGGLFLGGTTVKVGRHLRWFRSSVLSVRREIVPDERPTRALERLESGLRTLAGTKRPPVMEEDN